MGLDARLRQRVGYATSKALTRASARMALPSRAALSTTESTMTSTRTMAGANVGLSAPQDERSVEGRRSARAGASGGVIEGQQAPHLRPAVAAKRRATVERNKAAFRAAKLDEIERQVTEGSLVIRQMTDAERSAPRKRR